MSLIQEALRRQREEHGDGPEPQKSEAPPEPEAKAPEVKAPAAKAEESMPAGGKKNAAPAQSQPGKKKKLLPVLALTAFLIAATGAATIYLADFLLSSFRGKKDASSEAAKKNPPAQEQKAANPGGKAAPPSKGDAVSSPAEPVQPKPETTGIEPQKAPDSEAPAAGGQEQPKPQAPVAAAPKATSAPPAPPKPQPPAAPSAKSSAAAPGARPAAKQPETKPAVDAPKKKISWPSLKLQGILRGPTLEQSAALVNNKTVEIGSQINGATLIEIKPDSVVLQIEHETRTLRVGESM